MTSRDEHRRTWGLCTSAFALGQFASGYGFSYLFQASGGAYELLFAVAASVLLAALAVEWRAHCAWARSRLIARGGNQRKDDTVLHSFHAIADRKRRSWS
jgi:hypothetical protein